MYGEKWTEDEIKKMTNTVFFMCSKNSLWKRKCTCVNAKPASAFRFGAINTAGPMCAFKIVWRKTMWLSAQQIPCDHCENVNVLRNFVWLKSYPKILQRPETPYTNRPPPKSYTVCVLFKRTLTIIWNVELWLWPNRFGYKKKQTHFSYWP